MRNKREWVEGEPLYADVCCVSRSRHYVGLLRKHDLGYKSLICLDAYVILMFVFLREQLAVK